MSNYINFVMAADKFVRFAMAEDPAALVAEMQPHCPLRIELVAGCLVPPRMRVRVQEELQRSLRRYRAVGEWYELDREEAATALTDQARLAGGKPYKLLKRPTTEVRPPHDARAVVTPHGRFHSASEAARALGVSRVAVSQRALRRSPGWRYVDDNSPAPDRPLMGRPPSKLDDAEYFYPDK
jgi:hypothetical protein